MKEKMPEQTNSLLHFFNSEAEKQDFLRKKQEAQSLLAKENFVKEHQNKRTPIAKKFFAYTEGVPYKAKTVF